VVPDLALPGRTPAPLPLPAPPPPVKVLTFQKPAAEAPGGVLPAQYTTRPGSAAEALEYVIALEPPSADRLFRRFESEEALRQRMRQEARSKQPPERIVFPEDKRLIEERYKDRTYPPMIVRAEPGSVCHGRLLFMEPNAERYGWDLGFIQPFVSAGYFFGDLALMPYNLARDPCRWTECSAGQCLPGDPVPYMCYPLGLSGSGAIGEAGAVLGLIAVFP
jgi:hypothetical protein